MPDTAAAVTAPEQAAEAPLYLTRQEAAEAFKVSLPTLDRWIRDGGDRFIAERGGNGQAYQIDAGKLRAYLDAREVEEAEAARQRQEKIRQFELSLLGGEAAGESGLTADQRIKLHQEQLLAMKVRRERGELVEVARAEKAYERRMQLVADFMASMPDNLARRLNWDAATTEACAEAVDAFREGLAQMLMNENFLDD
jgi:phage terminase Nu1 subunit (DNA packaging protein)